MKKEHLNILVRIIGSLQAYLFALYAGFLVRRAYDISLYSYITDALMEEEKLLRYLFLAYSILFIVTVYGVIRVNKWSILVSMILGVVIFLFSFGLTI